jgi:hypothetical protein
MEELIWSHTNSLRTMLDLLRHSPTPRKLRLTAAAIGRYLLERLSNSVYQPVVDVVELVADTRVGKKEIRKVRQGIASAVEEATQAVYRDHANRDLSDWELGWKVNGLPTVWLARVVESILNTRDLDAVALVSFAGATTQVWNNGVPDPSKFEQEVRHCALFRDVFSNHFRPITFDPNWRTETSVLIARGMYESRDFSAMPILADALQDAGCENADILTHCRDESLTQVRGCWVVDLVLGKE